MVQQCHKNHLQCNLWREFLFAYFCFMCHYKNRSVINTLTTFIFLTLSGLQNSFGQTISEPIQQNFSSYFNGVRVDSCFDKIVEQIGKEGKLIEIGGSYLADMSTYKSVNYVALNAKTELGTDSIHIGFRQFSIAIGGSQDLESPIDYEHRAIKTFYFHSYLPANKLFKRLKMEFDALNLRFSSVEVKKVQELKIVYPLKVEGDKNLTTFQISLCIVKKKNFSVVSVTHRKIYLNQECN